MRGGTAGGLGTMDEKASISRMQKILLLAVLALIVFTGLVVFFAFNSSGEIHVSPSAPQSSTITFQGGVT